MYNITTLSSFLTREQRLEIATYSRNVEQLFELSKDPSADVRCAVARNRFTPARVMWKMLFDASHSNGRTSVPYYIKRNRKVNLFIRMVAAVKHGR